ncbi:hypothetical protein [Paenibacillus silvae]|uniref:hypothetical protein n=1 Tax=Paenibacillus silvae TaxID=1325358 RepID=UPI002006A674|nr:hypothetical protein [Paenibacillus silvae]MCK6076578.1 hypothetical protein [Paenibacillus silvae]MCK6151005.1 hypothetical protein [Paenibacillus silvae]MCK6269265.1 hypothetical protein [Paenibacillus silvae]
MEQHSVQHKVSMDWVYGLLTVLFFYTQLHIALVFAWDHSITLVVLVLNLLCLKLGEAVHEVFDGGNPFIWLVGALIAAIVLFNFPSFFPAFFVFGLFMMKVRDAAAKQSSRGVKIFARAIGFVCAPIHSALIYHIYLACVFGVCFYFVKQIKMDRAWVRYKITIEENKPVYFTMLTHHAHYFIYAYSIPWLFSVQTNLSFVWMGVVFYVGWAAYNAYEKLVTPSWGLFIVGHIIAGGALIGLFFSSSLVSVMFWWFVTGLGGGTVYMLHSLLKTKNSKSSRELRIAEGIGHVFGIACWGAISLFYSMEYTFLAGAFLALLTIYTAFNVFISSTKLNKGMKRHV